MPGPSLTSRKPAAMGPVMRDARTVVWRVPVPANGETKLTATITTGG